MIRSEELSWRTLLPAALCLGWAVSSCAADWKPERSVEIVVGAAAGGPLDKTARVLQGIAEARKIGVPVSVANRTGGGHAIALTYLNQHPGDAHYLSMASPLLLTNRITGSNPITYSDVTPLATLTSEYVGMSVKADSPLKTGKDVIDRLRASPGSLTIAITGRAGAQHIVAASIMKAAGVNLKAVRFVAFKGGAETTVAVLGGHVDIVMATPYSALKHVQAGTMRMIGIAAPKRLSGDLASIPTWKEQGIDVVSANWRGIVGPRGMTKVQVAYWDRFLAETTASADWHEVLRQNQWDGEYRNSADTFKFMQEEYKLLEAVLIETGDAKAAK